MIEMDDQVTPHLQRIERRLDGDISRALMRGGLLVERETKRTIAVNSGLARASLTTQRVGPLAVRVGPSVAYGRYVEFGRRAGRRPPIEPILLWVKRKLRPKDDRSTRGIAFAIARRIGQRGVQAQPFMQPAFESLRARIEALVGQAVTAAVE